MYITVIGWVIDGGRHYRRVTIVQPAPAGDRTQVAGSTGKHSTMSPYIRMFM